MTRMKVLAFLVCLLAATALASGSSSNQENLTVGDFSILIASRINTDDTATPLSAEQAAEILAKAGVKVKAKLSSPLTEKDAAEIFGQFGITLQAGAPGDRLDLARANALISIFGNTLADTASKTSQLAVVKDNRGGRASAQVVRPETTPEDCQQLPHDCSDIIGGCVTCHKCCSDNFPTGGGRSDFCAKLCQKKNLASPTDPTP